MAAPVEALRTHCRETAEVFERDDGLFEVGLADPLGPFPTRQFAESVALEETGDDPPDKRRRPAAGTAGRYSQDGIKSTADTKSEALDLQAEKLRRLFSLCRATAYAIASLAFAGGPR